MPVGRECREERFGYEENECKGRFGEKLGGAETKGMHNATAAGILVSLVKASCGEPSHVVVHTLERKQKTTVHKKFRTSCIVCCLFFGGKHSPVTRYRTAFFFLEQVH